MGLMVFLKNPFSSLVEHFIVQKCIHLSTGAEFAAKIFNTKILSQRGIFIYLLWI
jgi:hypothetical protein